MVDIQAVLELFQTSTGIYFTHKELLQEALTHRSFANESPDTKHNERLEFLGDSIIDYIVAEMVFLKFPNHSEGQLTEYRSALVRTESLAQLAQNIHLNQFLILGKGESLNQAEQLHINLMCRGFEAVIGAIYLEFGIERTKAFLLPRFQELLDDIIVNNRHLDARSILQERSQADIFVTPEYRVIDKDEGKHTRVFQVEVVVGELVLGHGEGSSKRIAAQKAARNALDLIERDGWSEDALLLRELHKKKRPSKNS